MSLALPPAFVARIQRVFGAAGEAWLAGLPGTLAHARERWDLAFEAPFPPGYAWVVPVRLHDGREAVLKARVANHECAAEIAALRAFAGDGMVRLLDADDERGLLLLERVRPGEALWDLSMSDEEATRVIARCILRLRGHGAPARLPHVRDWSRAIALHRRRDPGGRLIPPTLLDRAEAVLQQPPGAGDTLLHGDLHHGNVLRAEDDWRIIDPHGVVGDPRFEAGSMLRNPLTFPAEPRLEELLRRRVAILAEALEDDPQALAAWGAAVNVLSACWSFEGQDTGGEGAVLVASVLAGIAGWESRDR